MKTNKLPRPTPADYEKRMKLETDNNGERSDEYFQLLNDFDWRVEVFEKDSKYGLKNALGQIIIPAAYEDFKKLDYVDLKAGELVVAKQNSKWGVLIIDKEGSWLIKPEYDYIGYPNPITHVRKGDKWGVLKVTEGEFLIPMVCDHVDDDRGFMFTNGIGFYTKDKKHGVITEWGKFTQAIFDDVDFAPDEAVKVKFKGKWGFIDENYSFTEDKNEAGLFPTADK